MHSKPMILLTTAVILSVTFTATAYPLQMPQDGAMPYITGGVGLDARYEMEALAPQYNLHLKFSQGPEYITTVNVEIQDQQGRILLQAPSEGPWFFATVAPGNYRVIASTGGNSQAKTVAVGFTPAQVNFTGLSARGVAPLSKAPHAEGNYFGGTVQ